MPPAFGDTVDIDGEETANHQPHNGDADTPINSTNTHPGTNAGTRAPGARAAAGIGEGQLRMAIGLESPEDICADLERGLSKAVF